MKLSVVFAALLNALFATTPATAGGYGTLLPPAEPDQAGCYVNLVIEIPGFANEGGIAYALLVNGEMQLVELVPFGERYYEGLVQFPACGVGTIELASRKAAFVGFNTADLGYPADGKRMIRVRFMGGYFDTDTRVTRDARSVVEVKSHYMSRSDALRLVN